MDNNNVKTGEGIHTSRAALKVWDCLPQDVQLLFDFSKPFSLLYNLQYNPDAIAFIEGQTSDNCLISWMGEISLILIEITGFLTLV